jgi:hypothetical protein
MKEQKNVDKKKYCHLWEDVKNKLYEIIKNTCNIILVVVI